MPHTGRGGVRQRIPLPQSGHLRGRHRDRRVSVGRDGRHAGRRRTGPQGRGFRLRHLQRRRLLDRPRHPFGRLYPCGTGDRRGFDQGIYGAGDRDGDAGAGRGPRERHRDGGVLP